MLSPSAILSTSIALLINASSALASTRVLQTREVKAQGYDYNCENFIFLKKDVDLHMKDACKALKYSPEFNMFPSFFEESYLFPEYSDRVLFSWPMYFGGNKYQSGPTGRNRVVFTHLCELVALVIFKSPKLQIDEEAVTVCLQFENVASQPGSILNFSDMIDDLDRVNCGDQVMVSKKFITDVTTKLCGKMNGIFGSIWRPAPRNLFASNDFMITPVSKIRKSIKNSLSIKAFIVVDRSCKLKGLLYGNGDDLQHCTKAKIVKSSKHDADDHYSRQNGDEYEESLLKESDKFKCQGISLDSRMISNNLRAAKDYFKTNLLEIKKKKMELRKEGKKKEKKGFPNPQLTLEGSIWLWPLRVPEKLFASMGKKSNYVYFLLGLNKTSKLTGVYYTRVRTQKRRLFKRCLGDHETLIMQSRVTLGPIHYNPIGV